MMNAAVRAFARATLFTDGIDYRLVHLPASAITAGAGVLAEIGTPFCALLADKDEVTLLLSLSAWERVADRFPDHRLADPYRLITFDLPLDFELVGFLALVSDLLAQAGVSILALSAFERDHVFVPAPQFQIAWDTLKAAQVRLATS
jgi:hypothetical protein